ncbi:uncharacterized protein LOC120267275 [Dioscorea cayenensis subsp. rotundata]|uniref:Uncharacterized protein LOC120267275 n=1 Tax=Dioscorea cayennensis subsp. rotundata TaxID=55577 RepID=A0AB40BUU8_DIOCR|nr:uncharacterized protein LOC120267275 [Dioscorea cayenensis subsp. rotundata]
MAETSLVLVYYNGLIIASEDTIIFSSDDQSYFYVKDDISYENLKRFIADNQGVSCIKYQLPISSGSGKICYRSFKLRNDRDVRMMFDYHKKNSDIDIIELYVEFSTATFEGAPSQQQTAPNDEVQHNLRRERISSPCQYGRSNGDDEDDDGDSFREDTEAIVDDIQLEECNLEDVPMTGRMRFRSKDDVVTAIKHYCLLKSVEYKVIEPDLTRYSSKCKSYGDGCNWSVRASYSKRRQQ